MKYEILHRTRYAYDTPMRDSFNDVRLEPLSTIEQTVESFSLRVLPGVPVNRYTDFYGNWIHHFEIPDDHTYLLLESRARVKTHPIVPPAAEARPCPLREISRLPEMELYRDFLQGSRYVEIEVEPWHLALDATAGQTDTWQAALAIMDFVHDFLKYEPGTTRVQNHVCDVMKERRGVRQDYAHLMICLCRSLKIPARFVSWYLATETADATHAWVEVFIPRYGWQALDPVYNCQPEGTYVKIGHGRDYADVPPVTAGYHGGLRRTMEEEITIRPVE